MNHSVTYRGVAIALAEIFLLSLIIVAWIQLTEAKAAFVHSTENARECRRLVSEIGDLRKLEVVATEDKFNSELRNAELLTAAVDSDMNESNVASLKRQVPIPIEGTEYQRHNLAVALRGVTLQQLLTLALQIERQQRSFKTTAIQLNYARPIRPDIRGVKQSSLDRSETAPKDESEKWNGELILTQLVYVATSATR